MKEEEQATLKWLLSQDEQYLAMYGLVQGFVEMVRSQQATVLESWLRTAESSKIKEIVGFARSLKSDYGAVLASLQLSISNGQVEGQISRLKEKRQAGLETTTTVALPLPGEELTVNGKKA